MRGADCLAVTFALSTTTNVSISLLYSSSAFTFATNRSHSLMKSLHAITDIQSLREDFYVLACRYWDYITEHPRRKLENLNKYYENLLANQPEPEPGATDERSRAIRYAKEHHECFYEIRDIKRINVWLEEAEG